MTDPRVRSTEVLVDGFRFPEGPRWHGHLLFVSDMHAGRILTVSESGEVATFAEVPGLPSGLGWDPEGHLMVVSMEERRVLKFHSDGPEHFADLSGYAAFPCNDMVVDAAGGAYVGNFGFDLHGGADPVPTVLLRVTPDGAVSVAATEVRFPNGSVITPDGRTLVVGETFAGRLTAWDIGVDGTLSGRRVWAQLEGAVPDGICLDADGAIWSACPLSGRVLRVLEGGAVTDVVTVDRAGAFACMLGGADRRTLFVCTADDSDPAATVSGRGAIETVRVEVPGAGRP
ncbi:MAG: SMP-30/gluconolactonase/LRE family protein [Actinomycetes bacterium]